MGIVGDIEQGDQCDVLLIMFQLFKKRSPVEVLNKKYLELLARSRALSNSDRAASDKAFAEAQAVLEEIDALLKK